MQVCFRNTTTLPWRAGVGTLVSIAHNVISTTGEPAYAVDTSGCIVAWNKAAERAFGHPCQTAVGANCWELLQGRDIFGNQYCGQQCPHREMAALSKPINRCRMQLRLASGEYSEILLSTLALQEASGRWVLIHMCRPEAPRPPAVAWKADASSHSGLTDREKQVLRQLADGHSTEEIASLLSISVFTVRNHIEHILAKLDCHSRLQAVAQARKKRLV